MGRPRKDPVKCSFEGCIRAARVKGLCHSHAMQFYRGNPLTPLRERSTERVVRLPGLSITESAAQALAAAGPSTYRAARLLIEAWAREHPVNEPAKAMTK